MFEQFLNNFLHGTPSPEPTLLQVESGVYRHVIPNLASPSLCIASSMIYLQRLLLRPPDGTMITYQLNF